LQLVFADLAVDFIVPGVDATAEVGDAVEAMLLEVFDGLDAAGAHFADGDDFFALVELVEALGELRQGNEVAADVGDFEFVFVTYVEKEEVVAFVETLLEFFSLDFTNAHV
jgi:hypothetical protein